MSVPRKLLTALAVTATIAATLVATPATAVPTAAGAMARPDTYTVSSASGLKTEGIAIGPDGSMFVTSDATGQIFAGNVRLPDLKPFPATGAAARGTSLGIRVVGGQLWSVGANRLTVHNRSGKLMQSRTVPVGPLGAPTLNDLAVTATHVYVTDWANPILYRAERRGSQVGEFEPWIDFRSVIPQFPAQYWLLNGIVASEDGRTVLVSSNGTATVWRIDVATRTVTAVDMGDEPAFGPDGMVLRGTTLYAVFNYGVPHGVYVAQLDPTLSSGTVTHRILTDAAGEPFRDPTTVAVYRCRLYVVNHQDSTPAQVSQVSAVSDPTC